MKGRKGVGFTARLIFILLSLGGVIAVIQTRFTAAHELQASKSLAENKIDRFLAAVEQARSLEDVSAAFKAAGFSGAEEARLKQELGKSQYLNKLKGLSERQKADALRDLRRRGEQRSRQKEQAFLSAQNDELRILNQRAQTMFRNIETRMAASGTMRRAAPRTSGPRAAVPEKAAPAPPSAENLARILSLYPQPIRPGDGRDLFITGENFGGVRGGVNLTIRSRSVPLVIVTWKETAIIARLSQDLIGLVRDEIPESIRGMEVEARLSVAAERNTATSAIRLYVPPDLSQLHPRIEALSSGEITPSQELCISGENFLEERGRVTIILGGERYPGRVIKWYDSVITLVVPEIRGLRALDGTVLVKNIHDLEVSAPVLFRPTIVTHTLRELKDVLMGFDFLRERVYEWAFHDFLLQDGWTVVDSWIEVSRAEVDYINRPRIGGNSPRAVLHVIQPAFTSIFVEHFVAIQGPLGVPYR